MFHAYSTSLDDTHNDKTASTSSGYNNFGTAFDFSEQFTRAKNAISVSPNTDSIHDDISSNSGGALRESVQLAYLAPGTGHSSPSSSRTELAALGYLPRMQQPQSTVSTTSTHNTTGNPKSGAADPSSGNPLFHFTSGSATDDGDADSSPYDMAGLESFVMSNLGDDSGNHHPHHAQSAVKPAPQPLSQQHLEQPSTTAAMPPTITVQGAMPGTPPQPLPYAAAVAAAAAPGPSFMPPPRTPETTSPASSRGGASIQPGNISPLVYSGGDKPPYYSAGYGDQKLTLLPPQIVQTHPDGTTVLAAAGPATTGTPLVLTTGPMISGTVSPHSSSAATDASGSASFSVATAGANLSGASMPSDAEVRSNLFICGLPISITDKELVEIFGKYGPIESAKVMLDIHTGRSRGIAFVKYKEVEHAENAVDTLNGTTMNGHQLTVRVANSRAAYLPGNPTNKTFVRNVPLAVSRSTLMEYFSQFGEVTDLSIKSDTAQGRHTGSGNISVNGAARSTSMTDESGEDKLNIVFITYSTKEAAAKAAEATHTKAPFKECNGVPLLAKVAEDTMRRMERLSRRMRTGPGADGKDATGALPPPIGAITYAPAGPLGTGMPTNMVMSTMMPMNNPGTGFPGTTTYVTMSGTDLAALSAPQPQQLSVFRDANGNTLYAAAPTNSTGVTYTMQGTTLPQTVSQSNMFFAAPPPPPPPPQALTQTAGPGQTTMYIQTPQGLIQAPTQQIHIIQQQPQPQPAQHQTLQLQGGQGQIVYMQTSNGSMVPVMMSNGATAAPVQTQTMNPYFVMMNNQ